MNKIFASLLLVVTSLLSTSLDAQQAPAVDYVVDLSRANTHYITVSMTFEPVDEQTQIMMPVWTPGSYLVREYPKHVDRIAATDDDGNELDIKKVTKNRWQVECGESKSVTVKYRLYCHERSVRTNWVSHDYAILNGAPTFITIPEYLEREHVVQLELPDVWKRSATSLKGGQSPHQFVASNYHELVDSPIVAGALTIYPFEVDGVPHQLVNVNERGFWDGERAAKELAKIVAAHHEVWGNVPYDRYLFLNVIGGGGGGLEHDNCCLMMASRWACGNESSFQSWLSLASHEFFHTWNVRRLRPKQLVEYDYESENYTPSLWVAEGVTSYYEDLLLVRAGIMDRDQFVSTLSSQISRVQNAEGRKVQSLRDASHDAWIKFYRPGENSRDTTISYYTKGAIVALLLDAEIRSRSDGEKSLDDVMRLLFEKHADGVGYLPSDFRAICSDIAGSEMDEWFQSAVDSTDELDYQTICDWFGMQVGDTKPRKKTKKKKNKKDGDADDESSETKTEDEKADRSNEQPWLGVSTSSSSGKVTVSKVTPDSPAESAGLVMNDEIIAINDFRINSLDSRLRLYDVDQTVTLLIAREDRLIEIPIVIGSREARKSWSAKLVKKPTKKQKKNLDQWLLDASDDETEEDKEEETSK